MNSPGWLSMKRYKGLCFLLLAMATSLSGYSVDYNDEGTIANESYYESLKVIGDSLFAINLTSKKVEKINLLTSEVVQFSGGSIQKNNNIATDYSIYGGNLYAYNSQLRLIDKFELDGKYMKSFSSPLEAHDFLVAVGDDEFVSLAALRIAGLNERPKNQEICYFNAEKMIWARDLPLSGDLEELSVTILFKPEYNNGTISIRFPNAPYIIQFSKDLKKHRIIKWSYDNLDKAFEQQRKTKKRASGSWHLHSAHRGVVELESHYQILLDNYKYNYSFKILNKDGKEIEWSYKIGETGIPRPFAVWEGEKGIFVFYALSHSKGINYFKLDKSILK